MIVEISFLSLSSTGATSQRTKFPIRLTNIHFQQASTYRTDSEAHHETTLSMSSMNPARLQQQHRFLLTLYTSRALQHSAHSGKRPTVDPAKHPSKTHQQQKSKFQNSTVHLPRTTAHSTRLTRTRQASTRRARTRQASTRQRSAADSFLPIL